jgi:hypothetical protein
LEEDIWDRPWGDKLHRRRNGSKESLRIIFWNCGGFPTSRAHPKNQVFRNILTKTEADIAALAEMINVSWKMVHPHDRLHERMWGWFSALHISHAYASKFPATSASLAGGTAVFTIADAIHLVAEKSQDPFGRWSTTKLRGRNGITIRIISAYRCVRNIHRPLSVWNQQRYLYDLEKISADPIDKFDRDIGEYVSDCLNAGEQVVLGIDVNEDTRTGSFSQLMKSLGLTSL